MLRYTALLAILLDWRVRGERTGQAACRGCRPRLNSLVHEGRPFCANQTVRYGAGLDGNTTGLRPSQFAVVESSSGDRPSRRKGRATRSARHGPGSRPATDQQGQARNSLGIAVIILAAFDYKLIL